MPTNPLKPIKLDMTAAQVSAWCSGRQLIRKVLFPKDNKGLALLRPFPDHFYVIEHNHYRNEFFVLYKGNDVKKAIDVYLEYLCLYA